GVAKFLKTIDNAPHGGTTWLIAVDNESGFFISKVREPVCLQKVSMSFRSDLSSHGEQYFSFSGNSEPRFELSSAAGGLKLFAARAIRDEDTTWMPYVLGKRDVLIVFSVEHQRVE